MHMQDQCRNSRMWHVLNTTRFLLHTRAGMRAQARSMT